MGWLREASFSFISAKGWELRVILLGVVPVLRPSVVVPTVAELLFTGFQGGAADVHSTVHMRFVGTGSLVVMAASTRLAPPKTPGMVGVRRRGCAVRFVVKTGALW
jgi:hypothetical protein